MGKKWYVVTVGRAVGVFETWLETCPLVSGVTGALHQSFPSREEADKAFAAEKAKGGVRVVGRANEPPRSPLFHSYSYTASPAASPRHRTMSSAPSARTPPTTPVRSASGAAPRAARSRSPDVRHPNVSYTRGATSTPRASPRDQRRAAPRAPAASDSGSDRASPTRRYRRGQSASPGPGVVKQRLSSRAPQTVYRVSVRTPSAIESYPHDDGDGDESGFSFSPRRTAVSKGIQANPPLSPLSSPKLSTPRTASASTPGKRPPKHVFSSPGSHRSSAAASPSHAGYSPAGGPRTVVYNLPPLSIVEHCPRCAHCAGHAPPYLVPAAAGHYGLSQPAHPHGVLQGVGVDPRSPVDGKGSISGSVLFGRPSPRVKIEEQMSGLCL